MYATKDKSFRWTGNARAALLLSVSLQVKKNIASGKKLQWLLGNANGGRPAVVVQCAVSEHMDVFHVLAIPLCISSESEASQDSTQRE